MATLLDDAVRLLKPVIACDGCGWFIDAFDRPRLVTSAESDPVITPALSVRLAETASAHPFTHMWANQKRPSAVMLSDAPMAARDRHVSEHRDLYRSIGLEHLSIPVGVTRIYAGVLSFRRDTRAFTEGDRLMADLLQPHLGRAFANAELFSTMKGEEPEEMIAGALTTRESQVARWLSWGKTNREIALILSVAPRTVEKHVESILKKLHVENRTSAAVHLSQRLRRTQ